ncbi:AraC family transcriptional regulator [Chryseobacterium sp. Mn2064]|uniref:AraC family transcriptional regulator n=1 Tax=Chryseobacterium sp. Mn2064 TaxID=3395263 RepID=UPI003BBC5B77
MNVFKMHVKSLTKDIEIDYLFKEQWSFPVHKHTHYEIQFIIKGKGLHYINEDQFVYNSGDVFITLPGESHFFVFGEKTAVRIIKFNETFFLQNFQNKDLQLLKQGLFSSNRKISLSDACRKNVGELISLLINSHKKVSVYQNLIIKNTLSLILTLLMEETKLNLIRPQDEKIQMILRYIQENIREKEFLSIKNISEHFCINKNYFSQYFKNATGSTYKKYVNEYVLNMIAHQLLHQDITLSQLAYEFGFSDEGHLSRNFKAQFNKNPTDLRKKKKNSSLMRKLNDKYKDYPNPFGIILVYC